MTDVGESVPPLVGPASSLVDRVRNAEGLLVGLDFDGTLTPIADDPDVPRLSARERRLLSRLASRENVRVAVVSGRELDDLRNRVGVDGVVYAGNHGFELYRDGERTVHPEAEQCESELQSVAHALERRLGEISGCAVENKGLTLTVHVRNTPPARLEDARAAVSETVRQNPGLELTTGKAVFEVRPAVAHDKGAAMAELATETLPEWLTLYLGDDTTDEDAFEAIQPGGIGIHVGTDQETAATYRIPSQDAVRAFIEWLCEVTEPNTVG